MALSHLYISSKKTNSLLGLTTTGVGDTTGFDTTGCSGSTTGVFGPAGGATGVVTGAEGIVTAGGAIGGFTGAGVGADAGLPYRFQTSND